jgi:glucokinase
VKKYAIGSDIGGSHISCAVIDLEKKSLLRQSLRTQKVNNHAPADTLLNDWCIALNKTMGLVSKNDLAGIGFAMPGPFNYPEGIALFTGKNAKYEKLFSVHVADELSKRLELSPDHIRFINDATAFAVGEAWIGKAAQAILSLSVTLGTGFGSAFIERGQPVVERDDVPEKGCFWHLPFKNGIADDYFSTRWFIKRYFEMTGQRTSEVKDIAEKAFSDKAAKAVFEEFGIHLGLFLGPWLEKFDAGILVIGGNISSAYPLFGEPFETSLRRQDLKTVIEISELMEDAAIAGSARLFDPSFWLQVKPLLSKM